MPQEQLREDDSWDPEERQKSFWFLLSLYLESLLRESDLKTVEEEILPCLDEFEFLSSCKEHVTCISICKDLLESAVLSREVSRVLAEKMITESFSSSLNREQSAECISIASRLLELDLEAMKSVIGECSALVVKDIQNAEDDSTFNVKKSVILEEIFSRLEEKRLLDLVSTLLYTSTTD